MPRARSVSSRLAWSTTVWMMSPATAWTLVTMWGGLTEDPEPGWGLSPMRPDRERAR